MKTELVNFNKDEVVKVWPLAKSFIEKACKTNGGFNAEHILEYLKEGKMQLWMAVKPNNKVICCCVTEVRQYPNFKVCDLRITTGEQFEKWVGFMDDICDWAKSIGCKKMEVFARPGWERILKNYGYKKTHVQIEREL
tara:strand:- start:299 stop:712 length:414 start_codon:yes stop_codon:yes gene_type:complete